MGEYTRERAWEGKGARRSLGRVHGIGKKRLSLRASCAVKGAHPLRHVPREKDVRSPFRSLYFIFIRAPPKARILHGNRALH